MNIKDNKGVTGVDVAVAIVVIIVFLSIITAMFYNVSTSSKNISRKAEATHVAVDVIEKMKQAEFGDLEVTGETRQKLSETSIPTLADYTVANPYDVEITVEDYKDGNAVKIITAYVKYKVNKKDEEVKIQTLKKSDESVTEEIKEVAEKESQVKYYADIDGDGTVDGVIYADLAVGGSGQWSGETYTIPTPSTTFKKYYISQESYKGDFGTNPVISVLDSNGADRFYIMTLEDYGVYLWYDPGDGNEGNYFEAKEATGFGEGKNNTAFMVEKYGDINSNSSKGIMMWKQIKSRVNDGWFVPSRDEWSAFMNEFGVDPTNFSDFGLKDSSYWTSSRKNGNLIWAAIMSYGYGAACYAWDNFFVRLSITF